MGGWVTVVVEDGGGALAKAEEGLPLRVGLSDGPTAHAWCAKELHARRPSR